MFEFLFYLSPNCYLYYCVLVCKGFEHMSNNVDSMRIRFLIGYVDNVLGVDLQKKAFLAIQTHKSESK